MKNFRVTDGDIDVGASKRVDMVQGRDKLVQDLTLWLLEPLGIGFTTPAFGSLLNSVTIGTGRQDGAFIGRQFTERLAADVEAEVDRILHLYQQDQVQKVRAAQVDGRLYLYSRKEILNSIDAVTTTMDRDRAIVQAAITTGANQDISFLAQVDDEGSDIAAT